MPIFETIEGMSANLDSFDKYIKLLFMHSPAVLVKPAMEPRGGRKGSLLNSRITSNIDLVLVAAAKLAEITVISNAYKLVV